MRIDAMLREHRPVFSFEFFPPRTDEAVAQLYETVAHLRELAPDFVSVTYGAGGSTRVRTVELVRHIRDQLHIEPMAHLTCVGATREQLCEVLDELNAAGIDNVLALRGDPPQGNASFEITPGGLSRASELMELICERYGFCVGGACYPETHVEAPDLEAELANCRRKVEAGADFLITQLFFDNRSYFEFVELARRRGIGVPILAGIMPITNVAQIRRFTERIGASIPDPLLQGMVERQDDPDAVLQLGVAWSTLQCAELLAAGVPGIHFYTLNRSPATRAILSALRARQPWVRWVAPRAAEGA